MSYDIRFKVQLGNDKKVSFIYDIDMSYNTYKILCESSKIEGWSGGCELSINYLKQKFKTDDIMFLTKTKANKVIHSIKEIKKNLKSVAAL